MNAKEEERMPLWGQSPLTKPSPRAADGGRLHRYVFRYRGRGPAPAPDVARITGAVRVLDQVSRMLLVEGSSSQIAGLAATLPRWLVTEEHAFAMGRAMNGSVG